MKNTTRASALAAAGILLAGLFTPKTASAQYAAPDGYNDASAGEDIRQTVARVSYLSGPVSYARGDEPDDWQSLDLNVPLTIGDRLYTGRGGRAELQIHGGVAVRLDAETDLGALNLTDDTKQLSLKIGAASFRVRRLGAEDIFEVDTPNSAVTFDAPGDYRIDVDNDGNTRVSVRNGRVLVASGGGQVTLSQGDEMDIDGIDRPQYGVYALAAADGFDRWVSDRENRVQRSASRQYVSADIVGIADLDAAGRWQDIPEYGRVWSPVSVAADWAPYRDGHWVWQDPWGWTWVSGESWGWAPYHYGRWVTSSSHWYWVPVGARVQSVSYAPALVAFVGGSPGQSGAAFVGWFPLAPRDPFLPWWGRRPVQAPANVTYVNRSYVTVVNQTTFVSGGLVSGGWVRDPGVIRQVVATPVVRGPLPFVPTQASLRAAVRAGLPAPPPPPAVVLSRAVVARVAPPPAPPSFATKIDVIRQNRGAPIEPAAAARMAVERGRPDANTAIRPVVAASGGVTLSAGGKKEGARSPVQASVQPVTAGPVRGRPLATAEHPVALPGASPAPAPGNNGAAATAGDRSLERGRPAAIGTSPNTAARPAPTAAPAARGGAASNQDWRNRAVDRQVSPAPATAPSSSQLEQERRQGNARPAAASGPAAPQPTAAPPGGRPAPSPDYRRQRQTDRSPAQSQPVPTTAPAAEGNGRNRSVVTQPSPDNSGTRDDRRGRTVDRAAPAPAPPAAGPAPTNGNGNANARPTPEARGRAASPNPKKQPTKDEKKPEKQDEKKDEHSSR